MQYENKILNFHIYLYFPSNIFKKFKNIKIKGLTYYILTCIISLVFTRNKSKHTIQYARVALWWSISLPRRGSRVRSPSRALLDNKKDFRIGSPFLLSEKCEALLETQLLRSLGSISQSTKVLFGRARAKVQWTLWHPSRVTYGRAYW